MALAATAAGLALPAGVAADPATDLLPRQQPCVLGPLCPPPGGQPSSGSNPAPAPAGVCTAPRYGSRGMEIAVQDDAVFLDRAFYHRDRAFQQAAAIGARWLRVNLTWSNYKRYGFARHDDLVRAAAARGIRVQLTLMGTPDYDRRGDKWITNYKPNPSRVASFARTVAAHFKGCVTRYSIWNEPNLARFLSPSRQAPTLYRNLYRAAYGAIKGVDPRAQVLIGELTSSHDPLGFLTRAARNLRADGLAYHPFQFFSPPGSRPSRRDGSFVGISRTRRIQAVLRTLRRRRALRTPRGGTVPVYFTEFGYQRRGIYRMPESRRKAWAVQAFRYARRLGVRQGLWYQLVSDPSAPRRGHVWDSGLLNASGSATPTYSSLVRARASTAGL
jgi:hypothetical protein